MRFIRVHGRVVPVKETNYQGAERRRQDMKNVGKSAVGAGAAAIVSGHRLAKQGTTQKIALYSAKAKVTAGKFREAANAHGVGGTELMKSSFKNARESGERHIRIAAKYEKTANKLGKVASGGFGLARATSRIQRYGKIGGAIAAYLGAVTYLSASAAQNPYKKDKK